MNLISLENINKSYSEKPLFKDVSLGINEGEKIGVLGINGMGKSTLLKIIAGEESYDEGGKITKLNNMTIEYLPQNPYFNEELTILEQVFKGTSAVMKIISEYEYMLDKINLKPNDENLQSKFLKLNQKMDEINAWQLQSDAKAVLTKLGLFDFNLQIKNLSGGQKKRVALASALINPCDLLILDEPTNHMDNSTITWLEEYLNARKGSLLMVTHDRYFLDRVINKIIEIDNANIYSYPGNYTKFLELKEQRLQIDIASERKRKSIFRNELAWIQRGARARTTKQKARIERFEQLKKDELINNDESIEIAVGSTRLGRKVIEIENLSKSYNKKVIDNFSYVFSSGDRVGIIGDNGSGKTTFVNILSGKIDKYFGTISIGETVKIGYFSQENEHMDENLRVIDYIKEYAHIVKTSDGKQITASQMLETFLFSSSLQYSLISKLSGGEKRRLYLLRVLMSAPNVLILDEPTNDLDIQTLTILEEYLNGFEGTIIAVSHDRYFLDKISNKILSFNKDGVIKHHVGNYSDYIEYENSMHEDIEKKQSNSSKTVNKNLTKNNNKVKILKLSYREQKELDEMESVIEKLENELSIVEMEISKAGSDFVSLQELTRKQEEIEEKLLERMEKLEYLNNLVLEIENNKKSN